VAETYSVTAPVWLWNSDKARWHFLTIEGETADHLRYDSMGMRGGFGSVKVAAAINGVEWTTSVFPSGCNYLLPLKADVRRRAGFVAGDEVTVTLRLAPRG
jgi:hypothetical protein